jgi:hypothetical protein
MHSICRNLYNISANGTCTNVPKKSHPYPTCTAEPQKDFSIGRVQKISLIGVKQFFNSLYTYHGLIYKPEHGALVDSALLCLSHVPDHEVLSVTVSCSTSLMSLNMESLSVTECCLPHERE